MRIIARSNLLAYSEKHPDAALSLARWHAAVKAGEWRTMDQLQAAFAKAKVLNADRVRFDIAGGDYRLIAAFNFRLQIAFVKFIGSHAEYDRVDAVTVSRY
jgi:mRNA interferase HigB